MDIALGTARAALDRAAADIDADPHDLRNAGWRRALRVRALVESVATEVMDRVGRALGAGPLSHDETHGRLVADLTVYLQTASRRTGPGRAGRAGRGAGN